MDAVSTNPGSATNIPPDVEACMGAILDPVSSDTCFATDMVPCFATTRSSPIAIANHRSMEDLLNQVVTHESIMTESNTRTCKHSKNYYAVLADEPSPTERPCTEDETVIPVSDASNTTRPDPRTMRHSRATIRQQERNRNRRKDEKWFNNWFNSRRGKGTAPQPEKPEGLVETTVTESKIEMPTISAADVSLVQSLNAYANMWSLKQPVTSTSMRNWKPSPTPQQSRGRIKFYTRSRGKGTSSTELQADGGSEFKGVCREWCDVNKVTIRLSPPYAHYLNGVVERKIRTLKEMTRC